MSPTTAFVAGLSAPALVEVSGEMKVLLMRRLEVLVGRERPEEVGSFLELG